MARRQEDPRVTDLRRYRKARELQKRQTARPPQRSAERLLGSRRGAGLILVLVVLALIAVTLLGQLR